MMRVEKLEGVALSTSPAVLDFLRRTGPIRQRLTYNPFDPSSFRARQRYLQEHYRGDRRALSAALIEYNRHIGAGPEALRNAERLAAPEALAVVTGQQAGVAGGPLFTLYKAITAIQLARQQSEALGVPVIPVFWVAGEDHDFAEIARVEFPGREGPVRLTLGGAPAGRVSVGHLPVGEAVAEFLAALEEALPPTEFRAPLMEALREDAHRAGNLADWFARLMARLFRESGLVLINPMWPGIRRLEAPFFQEVLRRSREVDAALAAGIEAWQAAGYAPTLDYKAGDVNLFHYVDGQRMPLAGDGEAVWVRDHPELRWPLQDRIDLAAAAPEQFSTNVVTRAVAQGWLLPDLALVAGPGEIQYWGQLPEVFRVFGMEPPVIYPRTSATLIEPPIARYMEKLSLSPAEVFQGDLAERRHRLLEEVDTIGLDELFDRFQAEVEERHRRLLETIQHLDPDLVQVGQENRRQILRQIQILREKAWQAHRQRHQVMIRQLDRTAQCLLPGGELQERVHTVIYYLAKYGPDLPERLVRALPLPAEAGATSHLLVYLG
ncbi:MAG: bacillithiol biosynthesis cysteine-adding enzyme BshC [Firmicutes bacterium]|nr:bacillithiol biosynthesis cysteine-adding enzyme BshC [Bacillota bacterium]